MSSFICKKGHVTTLPDVEVHEEKVKDSLAYNAYKHLSSSEDTIGRDKFRDVVAATHDLGIDRDPDGREYIGCGWISDDDEATPDLVESGAPHALNMVRGTIKDNAEEEPWCCYEKAYKVT